MEHANTTEHNTESCHNVVYVDEITHRTAVLYWRHGRSGDSKVSPFQLHFAHNNRGGKSITGRGRMA